MNTKRTSLQALLLAALVFSATSANDDGTNFGKRPTSIAMQKHSRWMSQLPDNVLLSRLSLPGTHNSCALHNGFSFGFAKCQTWSLADQLKTGVRFIDIRCRHLGDDLLIYHGAISQHTTFKSVRDVCREYLKQHPTECIVMSVKEESTPKNNTRSFAETFAEAIRNDGELWHISDKIPPMQSVRRRIVLVDRVGALGGLKWRDTKRQDDYKAPIESKIKLVRSHFERAVTSSSNQWFINFCSGVVPGNWMTPKEYAAKSNRAALEYLQTHNRPAPLRLGTVVMDFPSEELIGKIVQSNFARKPVK